MARTGTFDSLEDILSKRRMLFVSATAITSTNITTLAPIAYSTSAGLSLSADDIDVSNLTDGSCRPTSRARSRESSASKVS